MLNQFPLEILGQVLSFLEREDLQAVRLVGRALSNKAGTVLFRTIRVSCLTLDRLENIILHPKLSLAVEELQYQEFDFDPQPIWDADRPLWGDQRMLYLTDTIAQFLEDLRREAQDEMEESPGSDLPEGVTRMLDAEQKFDEAEIQRMMHAVKELYIEKAALQTPHHLYQAFREAFLRLPKLRRVICVEADAGYPSLDSAQIERTGALHCLRNAFPLADHALRSCLQPDSPNWPSHGFMAIWRALSDENSNPRIQHFEIRRDSDLFFKRGIYILPMGPQDRLLVNGFRNLTVLSLCLEVNVSAPFGAIPQAAVLSEALARATQLRRLEICLTSSGVKLPLDLDSVENHSHTGIPFGDEDTGRQNILPFVSFPELQAVVLEEVDFTGNQICAWLFMQPKLRHLILRRPYLQGRWQDVLQRWSDTPEFQLDSFELVRPWDHDNLNLEENSGDPETAKVPSRVRSDALLDFINLHGGGGGGGGGGELNPFERRTWKPFHTSGQRRNNVDEDAEDDNQSDYSDVSEWLPRDHPTPVADLDGPEFDEEYDFDTEADSDVEMEEASPGFG